MIAIEIFEVGKELSVFIGDDRHAYRVSGPKMNGQGKLIKRCELKERDVDEIRSYLTFAKRELKRNAGK